MRTVLRLPLGSEIIYSLCFVEEFGFCLKDAIVEVCRVLDLNVPTVKVNTSRSKRQEETSTNIASQMFPNRKFALYPCFYVKYL